MDATAVRSLSNRERECLRLVASGLQTKEIAAELRLAPDTVDEYIAGARLKLGAPNRRAAARLFAATDGTPQPQGEVPSGVSGEVAAAPSAVVAQEPSRPSWPWPLRRPGEVDVRLGVGPRLLWILLITIGLAVGFGMLASGLKVVSDLVGAGAHVGR